MRPLPFSFIGPTEQAIHDEPASTRIAHAASLSGGCCSRVVRNALRLAQPSSRIVVLGAIREAVSGDIAHKVPAYVHIINRRPSDRALQTTVAWRVQLKGPEARASTGYRSGSNQSNICHYAHAIPLSWWDPPGTEIECGVVHG